jgi:hypothetical protein
MKIFLFSSQKNRSLEGGEKSAPAAELLPLAALPKHRPEEEDISYVDISGMTTADQKKTAAKLKKICAGSAWGIFDPKGEAPDPALFFFAGAADYIGPKLLRAGIDKKRLAAARSWRETAGSPAVKAAALAESETLKLPGGKFEGWRSIRSGTTAPFLFLFVSLSGRQNLRSRLGEAAIKTLQNRWRDTLRHCLQEAQALLWMEAEFQSLFLVPPKAACGKAAVEASLKALAGCRLIAIENLGLSMPVDFTFALHYGKTIFRAPGKTGTIVSDAVNYIFHLGTKRAEPGRLTIPAGLDHDAVPGGLKDMFVPAGTYEGIPILHSRRFVFSSSPA